MQYHDDVLRRFYDGEYIVGWIGCSYYTICRSNGKFSEITWFGVTTALYPKVLSEELFVDLCEMLPRVFRVASTRNLTKK